MPLTKFNHYMQIHWNDVPSLKFLSGKEILLSDTSTLLRNYSNFVPETAGANLE